MNAALLSLGGPRLLPCLARLAEVGISPRVHAGVIDILPWIGFSRAYVRMILDYEDTGVLALEDDVTFRSARFCNGEPCYEIPDDADLVYLGATLRSKSYVYAPTLSIVGDGGAWTTHAIHWTPSGIKKVKQRWDMSVIFDEWLRLNRAHFNAYVCDPMIATQIVSISAITQSLAQYDGIYDSCNKYGCNGVRG